MPVYSDALYHTSMNEEEKVDEEIISKEEMLELIDSTGRYVRMKSLTKRIIICSLIIISLVYFIGIGNKSIPQYLFAFIALIAAYYLGRNDLAESAQITALDEFRLKVTMSQKFIFKLEEFDLPDAEISSNQSK